jgi:hypothetical protein
MSFGLNFPRIELLYGERERERERERKRERETWRCLFRTFCKTLLLQEVSAW